MIGFGLQMNSVVPVGCWNAVVPLGPVDNNQPNNQPPINQSGLDDGGIYMGPPSRRTYEDNLPKM